MVTTDPNSLTRGTLRNYRQDRTEPTVTEACLEDTRYSIHVLTRQRPALAVRLLFCALCAQSYG